MTTFEKARENLAKSTILGNSIMEYNANNVTGPGSYPLEFKIKNHPHVEVSIYRYGSIRHEDVVAISDWVDILKGKLYVSGTGEIIVTF
jgi:hypothetical protein